ncbi:MAG: acetyl-CoA carboxylase biotin carboxyl carrier protein [Bacteroidia bacterium]|nr:acetyl-CoA carboxylase biotin carboxyl carrier protein [Bacteroidia bacterium]
MTKKEIEELIKFVSKSGVSEVKLEFEDIKLTIVNNPKEKKAPVVNQVVPAPAPVPVQPAAAPAAALPAPAPASAPAPAKSEDDSSRYVEIKSPMIGTFYRATSPDKPNFVNVGDEIKVGSPICIIEAMKLFNEIESEVSGKVVKVLVDNASPVQYEQTLMLIDPS